MLPARRPRTPPVATRAGRGAKISGFRLAIFSLFPTLALFGAAELGLWLYGFSFNPYTNYLDFSAATLESTNHDDYAQDRKRFWRFKPNQRSHNEALAGKGGAWIDEHGFRSVEGTKRTRQPAAGVYRIVALGDSGTFGYGVADDETWPYNLQRLLNAEHARAGRRFEVINAGVPGYTSVQSLRYFENDLLGTWPMDMLVLSFGRNDRVKISMTDRERRMPTQIETDLRNVLLAFRTYQLFTYLYYYPQLPLHGAAPYDKVRVPKADYDPTIARFQQLCAEHHITLVGLYRSGHGFDMLEHHLTLDRSDPGLDEYSRGGHPKGPVYTRVAQALVPYLITLIDGAGGP